MRLTSRKSTTAFGSPASCTLISDTSTWRRKPCNRSTTRSARGCHPCLRYDLLPMSPGWTAWGWRRECLSILLRLHAFFGLESSISTVLATGFSIALRHYSGCAFEPLYAQVPWRRFARRDGNVPALAILSRQWAHTNEMTAFVQMSAVGGGPEIADVGPNQRIDPFRTLTILKIYCALHLPSPFQEPKVPDYDVVPIVELEIGHAPEAWTSS